MFRDLKEYKNLQKLYEEKVSKVENINEENVRGANMKGSVNVGNMFKKIGDALKPNVNVGSRSRFNTNKNVKIDRSRNIPFIDGPVNNPEYGKNMSRSKEDLNPKPEVKKPVVSTTTKQGKPRTKAQMMAAKRKADGKTIQQVKDENKAKMIANARQRNVDFKAKRRKPPGEMKSNFAGGVSGKGKATDDFSKDPRYQSTAGTSTDIKLSLIHI